MFADHLKKSGRQCMNAKKRSNIAMPRPRGNVNTAATMPYLMKGVRTKMMRVMKGEALRKMKTKTMKTKVVAVW